MFPRVNLQDRTLEGPGINFSGQSVSDGFNAFFSGEPGTFFSVLSLWWNIYSIIAIILSLFFFLGFVYAKIRLGELSDIEQEALREAEAKWQAKEGGVETQNNKWVGIDSKSKENNPSSWRLAIIEADILLEETLRNAGYVGSTLGEMLKSANSTSFSTLQDAWEAHKVRNEIAHSGSDFVLTQRIAHETIMRFERIFKEFKII